MKDFGGKEIAMVTVGNRYFSMKQICESGQCFRLELLEETEDKDGKVIRQYGLPAFGKYLKVSQCGEMVSFFCTQEEFDSVWKDYFDLDEDYGRLIASIDPEDVYLSSAAAFGSGIRILRQDLWEMIISFIISQQNNIKDPAVCICTLPEIRGEAGVGGRRCLLYVSRAGGAYGRPAGGSVCVQPGIPEPVCEGNGRYCMPGEVDLDALRRMDYEEAMRVLTGLCGVGTKVANCICLFSLHQTDAFPVDTHISKVLGEQYPDGFPFEKYTGYAGSLQQYIFYYDLMNGKELSQNNLSTLLA